MYIIKLIIFILFFQNAFPFDLSGSVYSPNNKKIENVLIVINDDASLSTVTDSDGMFYIDDLKFDFFTLKASHVGYKPYIKELNISNSSIIEIILEPEKIDIDRIVVTGTRSERHIKNVPMLTHVIGKQDISNSSYSNVKNILEMAMPNVQMVSSNHGNDRVKIQGLDNKYLTFLVDGDRVSGEFAGNLDFSMLGLFNVDKIEVIEGAMSTLYGSGALGGVINIITKENKDPYWFNSGYQYDDPIGVSNYINFGFDKNIFNFDLNLQQNSSKGYDLSPDSENVYNMTLDENKSYILNHRLIVSPYKKHKVTFMYKNYESRINRYDYFAGNLIIDAPLNRYKDINYKIKYDYKVSKNQYFKISYINEEYAKHYFYPYYYSNGEYFINPEEFLNALFARGEINIQYNYETLKSKRLIGLESSKEDYSSFNIYYENGDILQESIFQGQNLTKRNNDLALYLYEERKVKDNTLSFGLRILNNENIVLPSISYLIKGKNNYNYRISYSEGYRRPSIKELYYIWQDHAGPDILGDPELNATQNNYLSLSLDKRSLINDFSLDIYGNYISNMISTQYNDSGDLVYKNYNEVFISGMNIHYYRKINDKVKLKFVYNLTNPSSESDEILEGISKHAFRLSSYSKISKNMDLIINVKYASEKFIFDQEQDFVGNISIKNLPSYIISDIYLTRITEKIILKAGLKNIFNYKDPNRFRTDILNNYDPGRRIFFEIGFKFRGVKND